MPHILSSASEQDRCPNGPGGSHSWRPPTFPGYPHRCEHCSERHEIVTLNLADALRLLAGGDR